MTHQISLASRMMTHLISLALAGTDVILLLLPQKKEFETAQAKTKEAEQASRLAAAESEAALRKLQMAEQTKSEAAAAREKHEEVSKKLEDLALKVRLDGPLTCLVTNLHFSNSNVF